MELYRIIDKLDCSKDSNKDIALKYDAGTIKSENYGTATLSGYILYTTRYKEFPPVNEKPIEEKAYTWLNEIGLEDYHYEQMGKIKVTSLVARGGAGIEAEKLEMFFKFLLFGFFFDDNVVKLNQLNENNPIKQLEDIISLAENLISIIESQGDSNVSEAAASKLNPIFKIVCKMLSHVCQRGFELMNEDDYECFAREMVDFIRVNKWMQEYHKLPHTKNEFSFLRSIDGGMSTMTFLLCFGRNVRIPKEIKMHPMFRRYCHNVATQMTASNDILSLQKEIADDEEFNLVLVNCQKHSLQRSIRKAEKVANELVIDLKKDKIRLMSYFPGDESLKNFIQTTEYLLDGFLYWYQDSNRYGKTKFETYVVEYGCDYTNWLEQMSIINVKNMKEPKLSSDSDNGTIPSLYR